MAWLGISHWNNASNATTSRRSEAWDAMTRLFVVVYTCIRRHRQSYRGRAFILSLAPDHDVENSSWPTFLAYGGLCRRWKQEPASLLDFLPLTTSLSTVPVAGYSEFAPPMDGMD